MEKTDAELIEQILAGDTDQYVHLMGRYRERFGRFARHMLGNREDAEEALQDTFVRAYRALARCEDRNNFDGWCFRILVNRCRTAGSIRGRREKRFINDEQAVLSHPKRDSMELRVWREEITHALNKLDEDQREAFLLKYVEELDYEEMSRITGVGVSALKMRVKRAREQLRVVLEEVVGV